MRLLLPLCCAPLLAALFLPAARAAFNPAVVSGDAQWVVHLDFDGLRDTVIGREIIAYVQKQMPQLPAGAGTGGPAPDVRLNFDRLLLTVGSVTAYGANFVPDPNKLDGALILSGSPELRKIAESLVLQGAIGSPRDIVEEKGLPFDAYRLGGEVLIGFPAEPIIIISKAKAQLVKAHEVVRGAAPSLAKTANSPLLPLLRQPGRSFLLAASLAPPDLRNLPDGPQARILQLTEAGSIALGETEGKTTTHLALVAPDDATATKLQKIVEGMTAMLSLAETSDRQLQEFLQSTRVARKDRAVTLDLAYSSERLVQMFSMIQAGMNPQPGNRPPPASAPSAPSRPPAVTVGEWKLDGAPPEATPGEALLVTHKLDNVRLVNGATIQVMARREGSVAPGGGARLDLVEISPAGGGAPLRFEAEGMRLSNFRNVQTPYASRGRLVVMMGTNASATLEFPGIDGEYTVAVRYVDESDAKTTLAVTVREPAPPPQVR